jgi:OmpA-OmpF porin, OOP family
MIRFLHVAVFLLASLVGVPAFAAGGDHPLVGRYEGSDLVGQTANEYDEVRLISGPIRDVASGPDAPGWTRVEGRSELYYYQLPAQRSSLEVLRNYEASLAAKGFERMFSCATSDASCYIRREGRVANTAPYDFALAFDASPELPRLGGDFIRNFFGKNARHLLMRASRPDGTVYASVTIAEGNHGPHAFVRVVTAKAMDTGRIAFVDAQQMGEAIAASGRISLYGILFDFDRDAVKPESAPTLAEIGNLLRSDPALRLQVVGHTDAQGSAVYNRELSLRRARNVITALVGGHGIDPSRLQARGAGAGEPVAPNDGEEGRAKNRRVELVRQ